MEVRNIMNPKGEKRKSLLDSPLGIGPLPLILTIEVEVGLLIQLGIFKLWRSWHTRGERINKTTRMSLLRWIPLAYPFSNQPLSNLRMGDGSIYRFSCQNISLKISFSFPPYRVYVILSLSSCSQTSLGSRHDGKVVAFIWPTNYQGGRWGWINKILCRIKSMWIFP